MEKVVLPESAVSTMSAPVCSATGTECIAEASLTTNLSKKVLLGTEWSGEAGVSGGQTDPGECGFEKGPADNLSQFQTNTRSLECGGASASPSDGVSDDGTDQEAAPITSPAIKIKARGDAERGGWRSPA